MFKTPDARLRALSRDLHSFGDKGEKLILSGIRRAILRGPLREEFKTGVGPGGPWARTARGRQALESKKLPGAFEAKLLAGAVDFEGSVRRDWLAAHQLGHRFASRSVEANKQFLTFNRAGRLIKQSRALTKGTPVWIGGRVVRMPGNPRRGVYQTFAKAHAIGSRVLPARPMVPTGAELPPAWEKAAAAGAESGLQKWVEKVAR